MMMRLRRVFTATSEGKGLAAALVETFSGAEGVGREVARRVLLGFPVQVALRPIVDDNSRELSMLARLLANSSSASARLVGAKGERLSIVVERWLKMQEEREMENRVMQVRSHIMAAVLGAVVAMLASLGPLVASLNFSSPAPQVGSAPLLLFSAAMVTASSVMLGLFMSGRRLYIDVLISLAAFALVAGAVAPLASVPTVSLWGIK
jgi:hypothetical protein